MYTLLGVVISNLYQLVSVAELEHEKVSIHLHSNILAGYSTSYCTEMHLWSPAKTSLWRKLPTKTLGLEEISRAFRNSAKKITLAVRSWRNSMNSDVKTRVLRARWWIHVLYSRGLGGDLCANKRTVPDFGTIWSFGRL